MANTITPKELATRFETDARTIRKFLRKDAEVNGTETPGKGSRWEIEAKQVRSLQKRFSAWVAETQAASEEPATED